MITKECTQTKTGTRAIMDEGPIAQPRWHSLGATTQEKQLLEKQYGPLTHTPNSQPPTLTREELVQDLIRAPRTVVLKPDTGANARGVVMLEYSAGFIAHIHYPSNEPPLMGSAALMHAYNHPQSTHTNNVLSLKLNTPRELEDLVYASAVTWQPSNGRPGTHNPGVVEDYMPGIHINGRAFETRHIVQGNLRTQVIKGIKHFSGRVGNTKWFSNTLFSELSTLYLDHVMSPLAHETSISEEELLRGARAHAEQGFTHYATRTQHLSIGSAAVEFDLRWERTPTGLRPWLVEAALREI